MGQTSAAEVALYDLFMRCDPARTLELEKGIAELKLALMALAESAGKKLRDAEGIAKTMCRGGETMTEIKIGPKVGEKNFTIESLGHDHETVDRFGRLVPDSKNVTVVTLTRKK